MHVWSWRAYTLAVSNKEETLSPFSCQAGKIQSEMQNPAFSDRVSTDSNVRQRLATQISDSG
ncbi:hypothetical protein C0081_14485 [Cohaesibacter celericrescens]|uniref:Uncharacterized protein n=1 Tax=Cohaesibacter celericrescens TaxID=2067669 RepID=A0A2N5XNP4_9HYPH|nr:hypothetical protein C0081_14485 [Cohaesibacter celericrescens]